jgi:AAA+ ATPase superfamily predicted ATPase
MIFFNRKEELQGLDRLFERERGRLAIAYGRRGIGKTTLVQRWLTTRRPRALYWCAPTTTAKQQLQSFSQAVRAFKSSNRSVPSDFTYASWNDAFDEILRLAERDSLVVILDDFEQLIAAGSDLPSALQRIWDLRLQDSNVMLFLIGSNVYAMEYDVLSYRAPMYGRAGWIDYLRPRPFADLKTLLPNYSMIDRITAYACVGGVPRYLELLDPQLPLTQNLLCVVSSPLMLEDAGNLLREQFDKPHLYAAVLESLARGVTDSKVIAQALGVEYRDVSRCLKVLERAKIIRWEGPATSRFPDTSRLGYYHLVDQYLLFYFHCLASIRSLHERGKTKEAMAQHRTSLDEFIGTGVFPGLCREWLYRQWETLPFHPMYVGANWGEGIQPIDLVAINHEDHGILFGKCNWSKRSISEADVRTLVEQAKVTIPRPVEAWQVSYAFFSRSGFTKVARRAIGKAKCYWVGLDELDSGLQGISKPRKLGKIQI